MSANKNAQALLAAWMLRLCWGFLALFLTCASAWANSPGKNGTRTITAANTVVNQSSTLTIAAAASGTTITVANIGDLNSPEAAGGGPLAVGDVILIYQARGATINSNNSVTYGNITAYGSAGHYEFQSVARVSGNDIGLAPRASSNSCTAGPLSRAYPVGTQVIRVPQYAALTVNAGASISTLAWNGSVGGIVAFRVQNTLNLNGTVTVSGLGFRGGILDGTDRGTAGTSNLAFASDAAPAGGAKGEGIASGAGTTAGGVDLPFSNPGGNFDIAAPANGGGGGGSHNGGGGGGANAASALTPYCTAGTAVYTSIAANISATTAFAWCGQGIMPAGVTGAAAWARDPGRIANAGVNTAQVGGGRGGYTYGANDENPTAANRGPGRTQWGGDNRHPLGGWGGRPLAQDLANRVFFGGGGGAGGNNEANNTGSAGGAGGGAIFIDAGTLAGTGAIIADGVTPLSSGNDAPGGGGAGGSIVVRAGGGSVGSMQANGGNGGNQVLGGPESEGPGGGGGGGIIAFVGGTQSATGGVGGTTNSSGVNEFPRNGATDASAGLTAQAAPQIIFPTAPCASLAIDKSSTPTGTVTAGTTITYTITISNAGPVAANGSLLRDPVATGLSCSAVTCTSAIGTTCAASVPAASVTIANLQGGGIPINSFPAASTLTFQVGCGITATGVP